MVEQCRDLFGLLLAVFVYMFNDKSEKEESWNLKFPFNNTRH